MSVHDNISAYQGYKLQLWTKHVCDTKTYVFLMDAAHFWGTFSDYTFPPVFVIHCESKKNWATFLRPITLEILNRSLPDLAHIKISSFWTSCQSLFKSTLENSGAIWRITLTVNKKVIKVMNWQWLCHAVVSAILLTIALLILSTEEKLYDGRPSAELHPRWQVTMFKSWLFGAQSELQVLTLQVSVFLAVKEGAPFCCSDRSHLTLMSGSY